MNFFDLHCDTAFELYKRNLPFENSELSVTASGGKAFEKWQQTFAVWIRDDCENPWEIYKNILNNAKKKLKSGPQNLIPVFGVEGGRVIENCPERIGELKRDDIKYLTLTWNSENAIGGGAESEKGLTDFGKEIIKELNKVKIATDLSHANEKTFYSALEYAEYPLASHSNIFELCPHKRNLKTEQIKLLAQKGGVTGITFYPVFLKGNIFESIYENIFLLCDLGLQKHIAIGSDFDGGSMDKSLSNLGQISVLCGFLQAKGLQNEVLEDIFYKNAENFIAKTG